MIYLDNNSTTPLDPEIIEVMMPWLTKNFSNADSPNSMGRLAHNAIENARSEVATLLASHPKNIFFTASATEANNTILKGYAFRLNQQAKIYISGIEHSSIKETVAFMVANSMVSSTTLGVDSCGKVILPESIEKNALLSVIAASNVLHTINDLSALSHCASHYEAFFHTDATQLLGKRKFSLDNLNIDAVSFSGHKIYGPKGVGVMYLSDKFKQHAFSPLLHGGKQEGRVRAGTLNVANIVGIGKACSLISAKLDKEMSNLEQLSSLFLNHLKDANINYILNGHSRDRLPGGLNLSFPGINGHLLIETLANCAISQGSACDETGTASYIFDAINKKDLAEFSVRIQFGRFNTTEDAQHGADMLIKTIVQLKKDIGGTYRP
jgi:cysteine desulfurase